MVTRFGRHVLMLGCAAVLLAGCLPPIMVNKDGTWRERQPPGPAYGSALNPEDES